MYPVTADLHGKASRDDRTAAARIQAELAGASPSYSRRSSISCLRGFWDLGAHGFVGPFSLPDDRYFCERVGGMRGAGGAPRPAVQGPSGARAPGRPRKRSASGQPAAKARRTRLAVSMTRAAMLISRSRKVENSALARSRGLDGVANGEHEPVSRRAQREADLIGDRGTTGRSIGSELRLVQLDEVRPARARNRGRRKSIPPRRIRRW